MEAFVRAYRLRLHDIIALIPANNKRKKWILGQDVDISSVMDMLNTYKKICCIFQIISN